MVGITKYATKKYDEDVNVRLRTSRFSQDTTQMSSDYPNKTQLLIDREDLKMLDYYTNELQNRCFQVGLGLTLISGAGTYFFLRNKPPGFIKGLYALPFVPMLGSTFFHYAQLGKFLDYCALKYENKGLWDQDLWNYHKANSPKKLEYSWKSS